MVDYTISATFSVRNFKFRTVKWVCGLRKENLTMTDVQACGVCLRIRARGMPPQPHPPAAEGAWLRPRPARQSPDCRRGRVHHQSSRRPKRVRLKAAAFPAQHIRSALSQHMAGGTAHRRLQRIPAGRRVRMRRGLPSPGSVGIPCLTECDILSAHSCPTGVGIAVPER